MSGRLIVIDGTDGSGKATQSGILVARLVGEGYTVRCVDFPRHGHPSSWFVDEYLAGAFGSLADVEPHAAALFFALDRFAHRAELRSALEEGAILVLDRYVSANIGHQGGKFADPVERKAFVDWMEHVEYELLHLPRPDLQLFLHLPVAIGIATMGATRDTQDLHESDTAHLHVAEAAFLEAAATRPNWRVVPCLAEDGSRLAREAVSADIWNAVSPLLPPKP